MLVDRLILLVKEQQKEHALQEFRVSALLCLHAVHHLKPGKTLF